MLCNKISEYPRKGFLQLLARGMNKIKKRIYFRTIHHSSFLLPPVMECFMEKGAFWDILMYIDYDEWKTALHQIFRLFITRLR